MTEITVVPWYMYEEPAPRERSWELPYGHNALTFNSVNFRSRSSFTAKESSILFTSPTSVTFLNLKRCSGTCHRLSRLPSERLNLETAVWSHALVPLLNLLSFAQIVDYALQNLVVLLIHHQVRRATARSLSSKGQLSNDRQVGGSQFSWWRETMVTAAHHAPPARSLQRWPVLVDAVQQCESKILTPR